jgi:hypothetical protein
MATGVLQWCYIAWEGALVTTMTIRLKEEEKSMIQAYARLNNTSAADVMRRLTLERIEEELDLRELEEAIANDDGVRYAHDEVMRMFGLK